MIQTLRYELNRKTILILCLKTRFEKSPQSNVYLICFAAAIVALKGSGTTLTCSWVLLRRTAASGIVTLSAFNDIYATI
jgi:hypothetical protein